MSNKPEFSFQNKLVVSVAALVRLALPQIQTFLGAVQEVLDKFDRDPVTLYHALCIKVA